MATRMSSIRKAAAGTLPQTAAEMDFLSSFCLAMLVHLLLVLGLFYVMQWRTDPPAAAYAEIWSDVDGSQAIKPEVPQVKEQPRETEPEVKPEEPKPEEVKPEEVKPAPPEPPKPEVAQPEMPDPQIVIAEQKKKEAELKKRLEAERRALRQAELRKLEEEKRRKAAEERKLAEERRRIEAEKKAAEEEKRRKAHELAQRKAEEKRASAAAADARRAMMNRLTQQAGPGPIGNPLGKVGGAGSQLGGTGLAGYAQQVAAAVRSRINFASVPSGIRRGQYKTIIEVRLSPSGNQIGSPRVLKNSGLPGWDNAALNAVLRTNPFPKPRTGAIPNVMQLVFDPLDRQ